MRFIICKVADMTIIDEQSEIIEKEIKQEWSINRALWDTTNDALPNHQQQNNFNGLLFVRRKVATCNYCVLSMRVVSPLGGRLFI